MEGNNQHSKEEAICASLQSERAIVVRVELSPETLDCVTFLRGGTEALGAAGQRLESLLTAMARHYGQSRPSGERWIRELGSSRYDDPSAGPTKTLTLEFPDREHRELAAIADAREVSVERLLTAAAGSVRRTVWCIESDVGLRLPYMAAWEAGRDGRPYDGPYRLSYEEGCECRAEQEREKHERGARAEAEANSSEGQCSPPVSTEHEVDTRAHVLAVCALSSADALERLLRLSASAACPVRPIIGAARALAVVVRKLGPVVASAPASAEIGRDLEAAGAALTQVIVAGLAQLADGNGRPGRVSVGKPSAAPSSSRPRATSTGP